MMAVFAIIDYGNDIRKFFLMARRNSSVTLSCVAKSAGVSVSTASRVLNKYPRIDSSTRAKVYEAVRSLGYDTSMTDMKVLALSKAQAGKCAIACLLCHLPGERNLLSMSFFKELFEGAQSFASRAGELRLSLFSWLGELSTGSKRQNEATMAALGKSDGVLVVGSPDGELLASLLERKLDFVLVGNPCDDSRVNTVETDDVGGGSLAAAYLLARGFKSIGFLDGPASVKSWTARRMGAMLETVKSAGVQSFQWRAAASSETKDISATLREWLVSEERPEALILSHSYAVVALEIALLSTGLKCPEDVSVVSFDKFLNPSGDIVPTALETCPRQLGFKAARRIHEIISFPGEKEEPQRILVPMRLVEGNSVKPTSFP